MAFFFSFFSVICVRQQVCFLFFIYYDMKYAARICISAPIRWLRSSVACFQLFATLACPGFLVSLFPHSSVKMKNFQFLAVLCMQSNAHECTMRSFRNTLFPSSVCLGLTFPVLGRTKNRMTARLVSYVSMLWRILFVSQRYGSASSM